MGRGGAPPAAGWMEARSKLQTQLDSLIAKTSAKMSKYGTVHAVEPKETPKEKATSPATPDAADLESRKKQPISPALTSLIKSVANEIQKSFSSKSLANCDKDEDGEEDGKELDNDLGDENNNNVDDCEFWRNDNISKQRQPEIDMEAPIDFDYDEPSNEKCDQEVLEEEPLEDEKEDKPDESFEEAEEKEQCGTTTMVLDASLARGKAKLMRRTERRLPGHVLAKRKAAEKLREPEQLSVMEQIKRELTDASQQVDLSDHQQDLENLNDEEKVDLIAKHMSKMETEYIMKLLKQLESGILDLSVPMLLPFLSLQVKLDLGRNIFKSLEPQNKVRVVKENFINDMISDITDIALLQEVIDRTQEKINFLCPPKPSTMSGNYFNIENDSFELPSTTLNIENDSYELPTTSTSTKRPVLTEVLSHIEKLMKEGNKKEQEKTKEQKEIKKENEKAEVPDATINIEPEAEEAEKIDESKSSGESDEGLPPSDCDSSVVDEEKDCLNIEKKDDIQDSIIDNKIDNKLADTSETKPKENNETVIKKKLRSILENCKTNEQSRPGRNFGRNFEFQNIELKPVLPNDKRTPKARRMDDMW